VARRDDHLGQRRLQHGRFSHEVSTCRRLRRFRARPSLHVKRANASKQVAPAKKVTPARPAAKAFIVFGADEYAKPRAP
jgi:hypothetical protein